MRDYNILESLQTIIAARATENDANSYTAQLLAKGRKKIAQKIAEEGAELAIAAVSEGPQQIVSEAADILFHMFVLLQDAAIDFSDVLAELKRREGLSGLDEKASR